MSKSVTEAVSRLNLENFRKVLEETVDLETRDSKGRTALFRAARLGRTEHLRLLIERGANVNASDSKGEAPLQAAARYGHLQCVRLLVESGANLDHCPSANLTEYSESALCSAARKAPDAAMLLLSMGADPNVGTSARRFPLITAAAWQENIGMLRALIEAGARVNEQDSRGMTALHAAIVAGSVKAIKLLVKHGADTEVEADHYGTAICTALLNYEADRAALVLAILPAKPNLSAVCPSWGMTPIELAREFELPEVEEVLLLAGSPHPKEEESEIRGSSVTSITTPSGTVISEIYLESPARIEPSPQDLKLAQEVCKAAPNLCKRHGWRASPGHWNALEGLARMKKSISLARIAYFVRGFLNAQPGKELLDGPLLLGESYQEAVDRFVEEKIVGRASREDAIALGTSGAVLKELARKHGLKVSGGKRVLITCLIEHLGLAEVVKALSPEPYFFFHEEVESIFAERERHFREVRDNLRREILELLSDGEFRWSCFLARDVGLISHDISHRRLVVLPEQMADRIARARETLAAPLPNTLKEFEPLEHQMRIIAAAFSLVGDEDDDWKIWDPRIKPIYSTDGDLLTPKRFRTQLLNS